MLVGFTDIDLQACLCSYFWCPFYFYCYVVPQGTTLGSSLFNIFINDILSSIHNSNDLKMRPSIANVENCKRSYCDIDIDHNWYLDDGMKLNTGKTIDISSSRNINSVNFNYKLCNKLIAFSQCVKDLGILLDGKLYFHSHVNCIFLQVFKMLRFDSLILYFPFSTIDSLMTFYNALVRSKFEYASVA
jgi:hypothetical protein